MNAIQTANAIDAIDAINALDLGTIKNKLMHVASGEGWSVARADAVEVEYRRFLTLMKLYPNESTAPLVDVDTFWHYHILDTVKYAADCASAFGYFLHHDPYLGLEGADDVQRRDLAGARMQELYAATFGPSSAAANPADAAAQAAWCGVAGTPQARAWCGVAAKQADAADLAWCGASTAQAANGKVAWCGVAAAKATTGAPALAWCGVAAQGTAKPALAWCGASSQAPAAQQPHAQAVAWCGATTAAPARQALAWCGAAPPARVRLSKNVPVPVVRAD